MGNTWENHEKMGKNMGKPLENGKQHMENHGKIGKTMETPWDNGKNT